MASTKIAPAPLTRSLSAIAADIRTDYRDKGKPVYFAAAPYVDAMLALDTLTDSYYADSADTIVRYALSNLSSWRGETAKRVKAELKAALAHFDGKR